MSTSRKTSRKKSEKSVTQGEAESLSFEAAMKELEGLVTRLEKGDQSLEDSLKDFERGVVLTRICQSALSEAEQKVQILTKNQGEETLAPFDTEDTDA